MSHQNNRMPHQNRRMMYQNDRMPSHQDRMPQQYNNNNRMSSQQFQNNRFSRSETARYPFPSDEKPPIFNKSLPRPPGNQMSFQGNRITVPDQGNSIHGLSTLQDEKIGTSGTNIRMPLGANFRFPPPPIPPVNSVNRPAFQPVHHPVNQPTFQPVPPVNQPTFQPVPPGNQPAFQPVPLVNQPAFQPVHSPVNQPAFQPVPPVNQPTFQPVPPINQPAFRPVHPPVNQPAFQPVSSVNKPTFQPVHHPVNQPAFQPVPPVKRPAFRPVHPPVNQPAFQPVHPPGNQPAFQPPSDEKAKNSKNNQFFQGNKSRSICNNTGMSQNRWPNGSNNLHGPRLPVPMDERFIPPKTNLSTNSSTARNIQPFSNYPPAPPPTVVTPNIHARPQVNTQNMNSFHNLPSTSNCLEPSLSTRIPPPTNNVNPVQNTNMKDSSIIHSNINIHPPNQILSNLRFPFKKNDAPGLHVNMKHPIPPPRSSFVPIQERNIMNNVMATATTMQCPPLSIPSNGESKDLKEEYKETMVDIVKTWTASRNSFTTPKPKNNQTMKIHTFKENLKIFVGLIEKLRHLNDSLAEHMEAEKSVWENLIEDVTKTKNEVINLQYKLFNPEQMKFITTEQKHRKKKRDRIRRRKKEQSENYVASLGKRIKLNEEIDEALHKQHTKIAMEKRDESLKTVAGESLVEVKRKQYEISKFIDVFNLLQQLRDIRKKTAIYQGIFVTEKDEEKFSSQVEQASKLLLSNAKVYENEERALRDLREEEVQEINRVEKEKRKKRKENRQEQLTQVDPMFPFRLYWLQGEESSAGLVHVRRMWDIFICPPTTPGGTRIPKSFVEPCKPCNKEWAKFLVKVPKVRKRKSEIGLFS